MQDAQPLNAAALHAHLRQIHAGADVAVFQIIPQLVHSHGGTVLLTLRGGCAQMGQGNNMGCCQQAVIGEIGNVGSHLAGIQRGQHGLVVHDLAAGQIDDPDAPLHSADGIGVDHVRGFFRVVDVHGNVIRPLVQVVDILHHMNVPIQPQRRVPREMAALATMEPMAPKPMMPMVFL